MANRLRMFIDGPPTRAMAAERERWIRQPILDNRCSPVTAQVLYDQGYDTAIEIARAEVERLQAIVEPLSAAPRKYGQHEHGCYASGRWPCGCCYCGLDVAVKVALESEKPAKRLATKEVPDGEDG